MLLGAGTETETGSIGATKYLGPSVGLGMLASVASREKTMVPAGSGKLIRMRHWTQEDP